MMQVLLEAEPLTPESPERQLAQANTSGRRAIESPLGTLVLEAGPEGLRALHLPDDDGEASVESDTEASIGTKAKAILDVAEAQLAEYFAGRRQHFELPLAPRGTPFRHKVWMALRTIESGKTWSYADLARAVGVPGGSRAVGQANGDNPIAIIIPCHRVVAANGGLGGYSGGLERKRWLLAHEGVQIE